MDGVLHVRSENQVAELHQDNDFVDRGELPPSAKLVNLTYATAINGSC